MPPENRLPPFPESLSFGDFELEEARWLIRRAVEEDVPSKDLTTGGLFGPGRPGGDRAVAEAALVAREDGVACGLPVVRELFRLEAPEVRIDPVGEDGQRVRAGNVLCRATGPAASILRLERIALNFLGRLGGIASHTRRWVDRLDGTRAVLLDTRKTTPGWRRLEKYAVRAGGARNHRGSLAEAILVKDNHEAVLRAVGSRDPRSWVEALRRESPGAFLQVEVAGRDEFLAVLELAVDSILLDNFPLDDLRWAVGIRDGRGSRRPELEASGGIRLETVREVAATGIDRISVGALTHSSVGLDVALDIAGVREA